MSEVTPELEKVARAMYQARHSWANAADVPVLILPLAEARAALEAIREPSEGMNAAAESAPNAASEYTAMIDHILGKEPTP